MASPLPPSGAEPDAESSLILFWANALGLRRDVVNLASDFFARGGDSMSAIYLQTRIEEFFGVVLPDHAVFEAPTPGEMADLLREASDRPIVDRVRDGMLVRYPGGDPGMPPLFIAIPGGIPAAGWLARHLDGPRGVGLIHLPMFSGSRPADYDAWFDRSCEEGVRHILAADPHGPWRLAAVCSRAFFFWEVARRLLGHGEVSLFMCDPYFGLPNLDAEDDDPALPAPDAPLKPAIRRDPIPAGIDLTLLIHARWPRRPLAERFAALTTGPLDLRYLPASIAGHGVTAASIALIAAELRVWLATRDAPRHPG